MEVFKMISNRIQDHLHTVQLVNNSEQIISSIYSVSNLIIKTFQKGNKVYFCGNGGSAADAQHLAAEFSGRFYIDRVGLPAEALHCNTSYLTAVANDYSYEVIYSRLMTGMGRKGDVLVGISTSGNSKNIINAFEVCRNKGINTVAFVGHDGGIMGKIADYSLIIPSNDTPRIQELHILLGHIVCEIVETELFKNK